MKLSMICYFMMFVSSMITLCMTRKHIMLSLLSLEYMVLSLFCVMTYFVNFKNDETMLLMIFLVFSVCEGAMGLCSLVTMIRSHSNDYLNSINLMMC
uniref:NADH-ubiquinone oxidoreductase chain 4L n=1 Tax=Derotettix mendosensis TaxID=2219932 RepID=A0A3S7MGG7_9HEMI|nr:NADH dehydrogenase subunit 4L [Derotettix mendosensis]